MRDAGICRMLVLGKAARIGLMMLVILLHWYIQDASIGEGSQNRPYDTGDSIVLASVEYWYWEGSRIDSL